MAKVTFPVQLSPGGTRLLRKLHHNLPDMEKHTADSSCLYVGSRYGENVLALAKLFPGTILGVDEDSEALLYARMALGSADYGKRVAFKFMTPVTLGFPDASLDVVFVDGLFTSYPKQKMLSELRRVLKPGGALALTTSMWLATPVPTYVKDVWGSIEFQVPSRDELPPMIMEAGFNIHELFDASNELVSFYKQFSGDAHSIVAGGFEGMKHMKSLVKHYKHEIDVYLKLGGDKFMGYGAVLAVKRDSGAAEEVGSRE